MLTKEQIEQIKHATVGRRFDLAIAETFCDWHWESGKHFDVSSVETQRWFLPPGWTIDDVGPGEWTWYDDSTDPHDEDDNRCTIWDVPHYSEHVEEAFEVVKKMRSNGFLLRLTQAKTGWEARFYRHPNTIDVGYGKGSTAAEAICKAALLYFMSSDT